MNKKSRNGSSRRPPGRCHATETHLAVTVLMVLSLATATAPEAIAADACAGSGQGRHSGEKTCQTESAMKIRLTLNGISITATLADNPTSRDFVSLLPLRLMLRDYASAEKIADLPRRLVTEGSPAGSDARAGDIAYYAPWGNLAIFYKGAGYASGLIPLARINADVQVVQTAGAVVVIERVVD